MKLVSTFPYYFFPLPRKNPVCASRRDDPFRLEDAYLFIWRVHTYIPDRMYMALPNEVKCKDLSKDRPDGR